MTSTHSHLIAFSAVTIVTSIVVPIVIASITAAITLLLTRASAAADRRRDHYALEEQLACQQAWIATESTDVAHAYQIARDTIRPHVTTALNEAWESSPVTKPEDMNLGHWGPAEKCSPAITGVQTAITTRFGWPRLKNLLVAGKPSDPLSKR
jgi:hypothetical protein